MRLTNKPPPVHSIVNGMRRRYKDAMYRAAQTATEVASFRAAQHIKGRIQTVGLGRLAGAVGQTSSQKKRQTPTTPYGTIYAKGSDESRAGQALEAYTVGVTIQARNKEWLAFATPAVPRVIGRRRLTPELYRQSGLAGSIGPLTFKPISANLAFLVVKNVTLHPRTHRAKAAGPRAPRTRVAAAEVVAFVLIRVTRRAKRFDKDRIVKAYSDQVPDLIADYMDDALSRGG